MGTLLVDRKKICSERGLLERIEQALAEAGKSGSAAGIAAVLVAASEKTGPDAIVAAKYSPSSADITDAEIIAYVAGLT